MGTPAMDRSTKSEGLCHPSKANKQRSYKLAAERKNYQLSFATDKQNPNGFFCITETKLASGQAKPLPSKWQVLQSQRPTLHREHQPAQPILLQRRRPARRRVDNHGGKRVRFASRCDQRFYPKGSTSQEQLVKISYGTTSAQEQEDLVDLVEIATGSSNEPSSTSGISDVIGAVKSGWNVQDIILLLQNDVDRTYPDETAATADSNNNWLRHLYQHVKLQKKELDQSSTQYILKTDYERRLNNLSYMQKLLNIYIHAETVVASARSLKQWGRFEIYIESISNLQPIPEYASLGSPPIEGKLTGVVYFSAKGGAPQQLGVLPHQVFSPHQQSNLVYSSCETPKSCDQGAVRYLVHHNHGIVPDEQRELFIKLYFDQLHIGTATIPCSELSSLCTQYKTPYALDKEIKGSDALFAGATIQFSVRKVELKRGYLAEKRQVASNKLNEVIEWVQRFNQDLAATTTETNTKTFLSGHICAKGNVSLLHAAILFQEPVFVQRLMKLHANPYMHSTMGTAMTLALNMSDGCYKCPAERKVLENILKILQGHSLDKCGTDSHYFDTENHCPSTKETRGTTILAKKMKQHHLPKKDSNTKNATNDSSAPSELSRAFRRLDIQSYN